MDGVGDGILRCLPSTFPMPNHKSFSFFCRSSSHPISSPGCHNRACGERAKGQRHLPHETDILSQPLRRYYYRHQLYRRLWDDADRGTDSLLTRAVAGPGRSMGQRGWPRPQPSPHCLFIPHQPVASTKPRDVTKGVRRARGRAVGPRVSVEWNGTQALLRGTV